MKASQVIARLQDLQAIHGDMDVLVDPSTLLGGPFDIDEIDVDTEDTGIIIWPRGEE